MNTKSKELRRKRVRAKIWGSKETPRLNVSSSLAHIRAQVIDDESGKTLAAATDLKLEGKMTKTQKAVKVGEAVAEAALKAGVKKVVFDRGPKLYHGRVKALADAARNKGLEF